MIEHDALDPVDVERANSNQRPHYGPDRHNDPHGVQPTGRSWNHTEISRARVA